MRKRNNRQQGFTLIELLTVIGILGSLAYLGMTSIWVYRARAGYAAAATTLDGARSDLEGSINNPDKAYAAVGLVSQSQVGPLSDSSAHELLPNFRVGRNTKIQVSFDPDCIDSSCTSEYLRVDHCFSSEYVSWSRFGDGENITLERMPGGGC